MHQDIAPPEEQLNCITADGVERSLIISIDIGPNSGVNGYAEISEPETLFQGGAFKEADLADAVSECYLQN